MWKDVVRNMPNAVWTVSVSTAGQAEVVHEVPFADTAETDGLIIATAPPCHVLVADASASVKMRITAASNHAFVEILDGTVSRDGHTFRQPMNRFDLLPLSFGNSTLDINIRNR